MKEIRTTTSFEVQDGNRLVGYAALWDTESRTLSEHGRTFKEKFARGAFDAGLKASEDDVKLFYNHDESMPLARTRGGSLKVQSDEKGLRFEAEIPDTTLGRDVKELLSRGVLSGEMSVGFWVEKDTWSESNTRRMVNKARLGEISIVVDAAYPQTSSQLRNFSQDITQERIKLHRRRISNG